MTTSTDRLRLYEHARESWGDDTARTLMDLLPDDASQLATKADLAVLGAELRSEMADLRVDMADLRSELHQALAEQTRTLVLTSSGITLTGIALAFAAAQLAA